jgi:hypothetical protein
MTMWPGTAYSQLILQVAENARFAAVRVADNLGDNPLMATFSAQVTNRAIGENTAL